MKPSRVWTLAALAVLISSVFATGYHHFDEHWQIVEFASFKMGRTQHWVLPWEYDAQMRPGLQPLIAYGVMWLQEAISGNQPFVLAGILRLLSGGVFLGSTWLLVRGGKTQLKSETHKRWLLPLSLLLWFAVYNGCRFSADNWSGAFVAAGLGLFLSSKSHTLVRLLAVGFLMGLGFHFKYQAGLLVFGFGAWLLFIHRPPLRTFLGLAAGLIPALVIGCLADAWLYGEWALAPWNYIDQNLIQDKVSSFGTYPWWWYLPQALIIGGPPVSLLLLALLLVIAVRPKSPVGWMVMPYLLIHVLIGHKELRFLFALLPLLPLAVLQVLEWGEGKTDFFQKRAARVFIRIGIVVNAALLLVAMFKPADNYISLYRSVYDAYPEPIPTYCIGEDPYFRAAHIQHYRRPGQENVVVESLEQVPNGRVLVIFSNRQKEVDLPAEAKIIYKSYPDWMLEVSFNEWQSRTKAWTVAELNR